MSRFYLSNRSRTNLSGVHPDLVKVPTRAIEITPYDFGILSGTRTIEEQTKEVANGDSQTMDSYHLIQPDGYGHAFDFAVYVNGNITWKIKYYRKVIQAMFTAAIELGVQIDAGGLWIKPLDGPHIQLNQDYYGD